MKKAYLLKSFYLEKDVIQIGKSLLGKLLLSHIDGVTTGGIIVETESYKGITDRACHAYNNRRTPRTEAMYREGGISYIYLCYGMHHLLNVVTNTEETPHAILIRAIEPVIGIETMLTRRNKKSIDFTLTSGPGSLTRALGITQKQNMISLDSQELWIEETKQKIPEKCIISSPRVGVSYAKEDALLPYRFRIKDNPWTSPAK